MIGVQVHATARLQLPDGVRELGQEFQSTGCCARAAIRETSSVQWTLEVESTGSFAVAKFQETVTAQLTLGAEKCSVPPESMLVLTQVVYGTALE
eukprot:s11_g21.t1